MDLVEILEHPEGLTREFERDLSSSDWALETIVAFVRKHAWHGAAIGAVRRKDRWSVPAEAVRDAMINAVVHTDYAQRGAPIRLSTLDDRIGIENPGLRPFGLTIEYLPRGVTKLRNRAIGRVFHALGPIERWDGGVRRMTAASRAAGLPAPPAPGWRVSWTAGSSARSAPARRIRGGGTVWPSEARHEPDARAEGPPGHRRRIGSRGLDRPGPRGDEPRRRAGRCRAGVRAGPLEAQPAGSALTNAELRTSDS